MRYSYGSKSELYKKMYLSSVCLLCQSIPSSLYPFPAHTHWDRSFSSGLSYLYTFPINEHMHVYFLISYTLLHKGFHTINGLLHFFPHSKVHAGNHCASALRAVAVVFSCTIFHYMNRTIVYSTILLYVVI